MAGLIADNMGVEIGGQGLGGTVGIGVWSGGGVGEGNRDERNR